MAPGILTRRKAQEQLVAMDEKKIKVEEEMPPEKKITTPPSEKENTTPEKDDEPMSYSQMIEKRKAENFAFLQNLAASMGDDPTIKAMKKMKEAQAAQAAQRKQQALKLKTERGPLRRSMRLQNAPAPSLENIKTELTDYFQPRKTKPKGPFPFLDVGITDSCDDKMRTFSDLGIEDLDGCSAFFEYKKEMKLMKTDSSLVAKVVPNRIVDLCVHPSSTKTLVAAASKEGQLGFWDVSQRNEKDKGVYVYEPHSERISCVKFNLQNHNEIYSSGFDGILRCGDLNAQIFQETYRVRPDEDELLTWFEFLSEKSLIVSQRWGIAVVIDKRTRNIHGESKFRIHESTMKNISVHPQDKNYFISVGKKGVVRLWDLRYMKTKSLAEVSHLKTANSAYFSPVTGKYVLSTSMDHKLNIFDISATAKTFKLKSSIKHDNFTGRWLTPFRAMWLPNNEDAFVVGSMQYPRRIEVFHVNGQLVHSFIDENLSSVACINAFHPTRPILAGGNSSGKVFAFMTS